MQDRDYESNMAHARAIARKCFGQAGGHRGAALEKAMEFLDGDPELKASITDEIVREHFKTLIANAARDENDRILAQASRPDDEFHRGFGGQVVHDAQQPRAAIPDEKNSEAMFGAIPSYKMPREPWQPPADEGRGVVVRLRNANEYDFQIWGGVKIGNATLGNLRDDMERRVSRRKSDKHRIALADALMKRLRKGGDETTQVQQIVTVDELRRLMRITGVAT